MLAGLLALLLAVTGVPLSGMEVQAEDGVLTEGDYRYEVNEDGNSVTITEYTNPGNSGDAVIPAEINYKFPNLPYYRGAADQVFFLGRPLGRFGLSSTGFFLGLPRFLGAGLGIGFERPRASSSSNT